VGGWKGRKNKRFGVGSDPYAAKQVLLKSLREGRPGTWAGYPNKKAGEKIMSVIHIIA